VEYRVGDVLLIAAGTFVGDCGRSIFLEQHLEMEGRRNYFRWEIPYPYIHHIEEKIESEVPKSESFEAELPAQKSFAAAAGSSSSVTSTSVPGIPSLSRPKPI